ncbi:histidine-specific methyltransferase, SAM-dependent domain-containing protein [Hirsutella rhossiliensis]|uniref:4-dimethylallyltryptophan N-methyltransferase n=1 Tax=Hirsutella rhossiliensis TaxID=111463 RepID=A0A9P8SGZ9_9HYPO|nr:histidine-specific methyltransferase, SAM-dependent domain-containing protein [Hirsutella rhossiliensis]KAH0961624.1 histidine-specific methyltransferase, SAM-dependent domain-containing protein [Hirsutella rhossiliensis]
MHGAVGDRLVRTLTAMYTPHAKPTLPDELLYDDVGLPIWNEIIFTPEFYQTHDEISLLDDHGDEIVAHLEPGVTVVDLGAGDTRKVEHLLAAFELAIVPATYLALDISQASLVHNISYLVEKHSAPGSAVRCAGLWGTFRDGKDYVQRIRGPRLFLSLGSVLCNDPWLEALNHLKYWAGAMRQDDLLLIGMDAHMLPLDKDKIWAAYHSRNDLYRRFFLNGFEHANRLAGEEWFREDDWVFGAQLEDKPTTRHRFFLRAKREIRLVKLGRVIAAGEELDWFDSHKYDEASVQLMCSKAGLSVVDVWKLPKSEFRQYLLKIKDKNQKEDADSAVSGV